MRRIHSSGRLQHQLTRTRMIRKGVRIIGSGGPNANGEDECRCCSSLGVNVCRSRRKGRGRVGVSVNARSWDQRSLCPSLTSHLFPAFPRRPRDPCARHSPTRTQRRRRRRRSARSRANAPSLPRRPASRNDRALRVVARRRSAVCRLGTEYKLEVGIRSGVSGQFLSLSRSFSRPTPTHRPSPAATVASHRRPCSGRTADSLSRRGICAPWCVDLRERDERRRPTGNISFSATSPERSRTRDMPPVPSTRIRLRVGVVLFLCNGRRSVVRRYLANSSRHRQKQTQTVVGVKRKNTGYVCECDFALGCCGCG
ncbi:hypothetical protein C8F01DRAFT_1143734 [Mycena amicta]|nr:hypothetical protein C8F01DRAFT_1143734 [Mycena amicta]